MKGIPPPFDYAQGRLLVGMTNIFSVIILAQGEGKIMKTQNKKELTIEDTLCGSKKQHDFYKGKWKPLKKPNGVYKALWLVGELGEVIDIIKKKGPDAINGDKETRSEFVKEIVDCYMYIADVLNCYGITADEIGEEYFNKLNYNLKNPRRYWNDKSKDINKLKHKH